MGLVLGGMELVISISVNNVRKIGSEILPLGWDGGLNRCAFNQDLSHDRMRNILYSLRVEELRILFFCGTAEGAIRSR